MKKISTLVLSLAASVSAFAQTQLSNGGFENWGGNSSPGVSAEPTGWYSNKSGSSVAQLGPQICFQDQSVVHSGTSSVRVETKSYIGTAVNGAVTTGVINAPSTNKSNGYIGTVNYSSSSDDRRTAFTGRPDSIVGYYQYTSGGSGEQGKVRVILHTGDYFDPETPTTYHADPTANKIADALFLTPTSSVGTWTRFSVPFTYTSSATPAYIMVNITSSANQTTTVSGSKMWVDDISFIYNSTTGIHEQAQAAVKLYPNPATDVLTIEPGNHGGTYSVEVIDVTGKQVYSAESNEASYKVNTSRFSQGLYSVHVTMHDSGMALQARFIKD